MAYSAPGQRDECAPDGVGAGPPLPVGVIPRVNFRLSEGAAVQNRRFRHWYARAIGMSWTVVQV